LERLALFYAGRYATTRARLSAYLSRKLSERGWAGEGEGEAEAEVAGLAERLAELGYVDDRAFAEARAGSLLRRGYGARRVEETLRAAGIGEEEGGSAREAARQGAWQAALRFAERRRYGPFADAPADRDAQRRQVAAMLRAGHALETARRIVTAGPGSIPESDGF
jgi:regulatory protein